mgnify:CR=1 FL=1
MVRSLRRSDSSTALIGLEAAVAISAVFGSAELILDGPHFMGGTVEANQLPYSSWTLAGVALLLVNGVLPALAILADHRHAPDATTLHAVAGAALMLWIVVQVMTIGLVFALQPVMFVIGAAIFLLALWRGSVRS